MPPSLLARSLTALALAGLALTGCAASSDSYGALEDSIQRLDAAVNDFAAYEPTVETEEQAAEMFAEADSRLYTAVAAWDDAVEAAANADLPQTASGGIPSEAAVNDYLLRQGEYLNLNSDFLTKLKGCFENGAPSDQFAEVARGLCVQNYATEYTDQIVVLVPQVMDAKRQLDEETAG